MKKKLLFLSVVTLFLCGGVFTATQLTQKEKVSNLTLANIEAMTGTDDVGGGGQCRWHYMGKHNSGCLLGGEGNVCTCGDTTQPLSR